MSFSVDEEVKCKAYKELIKELNQEIKDKNEEKEKLEIEYFKKWLLNGISQEKNNENEKKYGKEVNDIINKIREEENSIIKLENAIEDLQNRFDRKYGKK
jgi:hypothetical protein